MVQKTIVTLVDDIDGSRGDETVQFGLDKNNYEIDLNGENAVQLREALAPFIEVARKVTVSQPKSSGGRRGRDPENPKIRAWAKQQGIEIGTKGRIPKEIVAAYRGGSG